MGRFLNARNPLYRALYLNIYCSHPRVHRQTLPTPLHATWPPRARRGRHQKVKRTRTRRVPKQGARGFWLARHPAIALSPCVRSNVLCVSIV